MQKSRLALTLLACSLPLLACAQAPVYDSSEPDYGSSRAPSAPAQAGGAYAGGGATAPSSAEGMIFMQLQQMQGEIAQLRGMLEEQQNDIRRLEREALERYQELDGRLSSSQAPAASSSQNSTAAPADAGASAAQAPSEPGDPAKEKLYYDAAFDLIKAKDFDKASQAFGAFLRRYPNSQYAGNAQYWLGEVNLAKGDLQAAGQAFSRVGQAYPDHPKVPDALYKLGDVEQRLGNADRAQGLFAEVVKRYPGSSAAQLAQRQLRR